MADFIISQTDAQLQAILNKIQPIVDTVSVAPLGFGYGVCETAGATAAKTVSITNTVLTPGGIIAVNFVNAFTASSPTLSVNGSAAKPIKLYGNAMPMGKVHANTILVMYYDGTQFNVIGILSQTAAAPTGFVDLALPSGLLWCEHNVGASTPYEDGLYFSWGNVIGHAELCMIRNVINQFSSETLFTRRQSHKLTGFCGNLGVIVPILRSQRRIDTKGIRRPTMTNVMEL